MNPTSLVSQTPREAQEPEQPWPMVHGEPRDIATFYCDIVRVAQASEKRNLELQ
jgi:hypothetical protein